ncbi:MAG: GNAT family N-acetyltransferase [Chitinivibrionales bacterium]|nr:GNAT family N-acetyltransferase [Chitinivibrionales bacterium]
MIIDTLRHSRLTSTQTAAINSLQKTIWPQSRRLTQKMPLTFIDDPIHYVAWEDDRAIAHAMTFLRTIITSQGHLPILALRAVCTHPAYRGRNLGRDVVTRAFARIDGSMFVASLFQTNVPVFYKKIGARQVSNAFINSTHPSIPQASPWWDPFVMVYPRDTVLPAGCIDLNGGGY